jgi:amino acid transporter
MATSWRDDAPKPAVLADHVHPKDPLSYTIKRKLLGAPLNRHSLGDQRLKKRSAFGILSSDCISSSAYGGEQILVALIPAFGLAAFALFSPMICVILFILLIISLSYRDVINTYTRAGGAYVVARDNFGTKTSLVAAIELMFGYIITVAIQAAAGVAAIISAVPELSSYKIQLTLGIIFLLTFINLRGVKDAGVIFVIPSYLFIFSMLVVFVMGIIRYANGSLPQYSSQTPGLLPLGEEQGLLTFAAILMILKAFASGSASLTGLEAVSDSVPLFKSPEHVNARRTFVAMALTLALLIIGIGWLAYHTLAIPYESGTPTVISLVAKAALGEGMMAHLFFLIVQTGTTLILFAGANTCYSAFPNMVNIVAHDGFLPKRLTSRGHRLAFSNGILFIAVTASVLVIASKASITALAAIYALSVFIGFMITGLGMAKKSYRENSRAKMLLHLVSGFIATITVVILSLAKFFDGTWLVVIGTPILLMVLNRVNKRYREEQKALSLNTGGEGNTNITRHDVAVLIDNVDIATIGAVRYARSLKPRKLTAIHFVIDDLRAERIKNEWTKTSALDGVSLELIDCPDRRLPKAAIDYSMRATQAEDVELTLLLPRRSYSQLLGRLLHDQTAEEIARSISKLPRVVATIIPFDVEKIIDGTSSVLSNATLKVERFEVLDSKPLSTPISFEPVSHGSTNSIKIGNITWRKRALVVGRVTAIRVAPQNSAPVLEVEIWDETGGVTLQFLGRRELMGLNVGATLQAEGMVGDEDGALKILNPAYQIIL